MILSQKKIVKVSDRNLYIIGMKILTSQYDKVDSVYYSLIDILRYVAFFGLVVISMILSITFYVSAVEAISSKIMLGFAAFALESVKVYSLIHAEYTWFSMRQKSKNKLQFKGVFRAGKAYALFAALTLLSIIASISFAQASIYSIMEEVQVVMDNEAEVAARGNPLIEAKQTLLANKQVQLETFNQRIEDLPVLYVTNSLQYSDEVNQLNDDIYDLSEEIALLQIKEFENKVETADEMSEKKETFNRFFLLGEPIGLSETETLFLFLLLFAVLLEMGIIATAPAPEKRSIRELIQGRVVQEIAPLSPSQEKKITKLHDRLKARPKNVAVKAKKADIRVQAVPPKEVKAEKEEVIQKRGTSQQLLNELYEKGNSYLMDPAKAAYRSKRSASEYLKLLEKLATLKPRKDSASLLSRDNKGYKMNYSFEYIKSAVKDKK